MYHFLIWMLNPNNYCTKGYSISFLITKRHVDELSKRSIIEFITYFIQEADKEISSLKIAMNARGRSIANEYMKLFN